METWKPIPGYEGFYEVSNLGRVKRLSGFVEHEKWRQPVAERILKPSRKNGYQAVSLTVKGRKRVYEYVHKIVLETFVGKRPEGMLCCHGRNGIDDNSVDNLRYGTAADNYQDMIDFGNPNFTGGKKKLSDQQVQQIRSMEGTTREIAKCFNIDHGYVACLKRGKYRSKV